MNNEDALKTISDVRAKAVQDLSDANETIAKYQQFLSGARSDRDAAKSIIDRCDRVLKRRTLIDVQNAVRWMREQKGGNPDAR